MKVLFGGARRLWSRSNAGNQVGRGLTVTETVPQYTGANGDFTKLEPIRVIVVDDHSVGRLGLRTVLAEHKGITLVAEGETGAQACELAEKHKPQVLLIDWTLPDGNGLEVIRQVRRLSPTTQVLVLAKHDKELYLVDAVVAGAAGFLLKDSPAQLIPLAIQTLFQGGCLLEKRLLDRLVRLAASGRREDEMTQPVQASNLSERELAVLRLISRGSSNRVIGEKLHLAEATVKKYVHSLKSKLSVSDRAEAAVVGLRLGLLE